VDQLLGVGEQRLGTLGEPVELTLARFLCQHDLQSSPAPDDLNGLTRFEHLVEDSVDVLTELGRGDSHESRVAALRLDV
jgi:hypothetical protein